MTLDAALLLARAHKVTSVCLDRALSRIGVDFDTLRRLREIGTDPDGVSLGRFASGMVETRSQALRAVRPLQKLGWVEGTSGGYTLTGSGRRLLDEAEEIADRTAAQQLAEAGIDPRELSEQIGPLLRSSPR